MGISKYERVVAHGQLKEEYTLETWLNNRRKTGFKFKVSSYSLQSAVSIVISTIKHIPQGIPVNNLRECPLSSRKKPNVCRSPTVLCRGLDKSRALGAGQGHGMLMCKLAFSAGAVRSEVELINILCTDNSR